MTLLLAAYKRILYYWPRFARINRAKQPDDLLEVIRFEQETTPPTVLLELKEVKDPKHRQEMIKDPDIIKVYYTDKIMDKFKYLAFIELGIKYLDEHGEVAAAEVGRVILRGKMTEESKDWGGNATTGPLY